MHGCGCETCGGACAWDDRPETEEDMGKLDGPDGINEEWWDKEMSRPRTAGRVFPIPPLKPVTNRPRKLDPAAWGEGDPQDPRELFWVDAHNTLVAITYMLQEQKVLGIFNETTEALLTAAKWALDAEFAKGNRVVEEEADVAF